MTSHLYKLGGGGMESKMCEVIDLFTSPHTSHTCMKQVHYLLMDSDERLEIYGQHKTSASKYRLEHGWGLIGSKPRAGATWFDDHTTRVNCSNTFSTKRP